MAFSISGIKNFVTDRKIPEPEIEGILERAHAAAKDFGDGTTFSGGKIAEVLGFEQLTADYLQQRELNLERYS